MTDDQARVLAFERQRFTHAGNKEAAIRDELGISPTRYYQLLAQLLDDREALAVDPLLVNRLRRLRTSRVAARNARRAG